MKHFIVLLLFFNLACSNPSSEAKLTDLEQLMSIDQEFKVFVEDMTEWHDAIPSGVPPIGWDKGPRVGYGNNPPPEWNAMIPWGQVYTDLVGNEAENVRFQIKNLQAWYLSKSTGKWEKWIMSSHLGGANYAEDFQDDIHIKANIRTESDQGGGISSTLVSGYNFHFWTEDGRVEIDPNDIAAVWSAVDARLILDDPQLSDQRNEARFMMSVGADYWLNLNTPWDQWKTNGDIFIGRFRYLNTSWQRFHGHTLTKEQLQKGPLPPYKMGD